MLFPQRSLNGAESTRYFWGVLYAENFPSAEAINVETRIVKFSQAAQILEERKGEEPSVLFAHLWRCLKCLLLCIDFFFPHKMEEWRCDPIECQKNPV